MATECIQDSLDFGTVEGRSVVDGQTLCRASDAGHAGMPGRGLAVFHGAGAQVLGIRPYSARRHAGPAPP
jgi:hypothetical protein